MRASHPVDHHLGARVRLARAERGISQTALGESIGVTFQQIQKYERGTNRISASKLLGIAKALDKDISFFFNDVEEGAVARDQAETTAANAPTRYDLKLMTLLSKIDDSNLKRRLYLLMEAIVLNRVDGSVGAEKNATID